MVPELDGDAPWEHACREGWEGVIAKRRDSPYESRRSPHWLKMKCEATQELVIGGFTDPQGARVGLGALLVGYYEQGRLRLRRQGRHRLRHEAAQRAARAARQAGAREAAVHQGHRAAEAAHALGEAGDRRAGGVHGMDAGDKLRHPRLLGLRPDKAAREVVREQGGGKDGRG